MVIFESGQLRTNEQPPITGKMFVSNDLVISLSISFWQFESSVRISFALTRGQFFFSENCVMFYTVGIWSEE